MSTPAQLLQADRRRFPGLLPRETLVLRAWLKLHEAEYERLQYNVRVGEGQDPGPQYPSDIRAMAVLNTQKRIDAVAYQPGAATIIEVKDRAGPSVIGQLLVYASLFPLAHPEFPRPGLLIVCNRAVPDILPAVRAAGIEIEQVDVDYSLLLS